MPASSSKTVSFRANLQTYRLLCDYARTQGMTPGGFAKDAALQRIMELEGRERELAQLRAEVRELKRMLSLSTEGVMTLLVDCFSGNAPERREEIEQWVRERLPR